MVPMANYTNEEYCDMHFMYGAALGNSSEARRLYAERFPQRQLPSIKTFTAIHNRLREFGTFQINRADTGRDKSIRSVEFEEDVLNKFEENPRTSTRVVASEMNTSNATVWRVLHDEKLYPFHLQKVHSLEPRDYPRRVACSRWFLHKLADDPDFLKKVMFTDESSFNRDGIFNSRNSHVWAEENPHKIIQKGNQNRFSINVWAGVFGDHVIGPYILPNRLNSPTYLVFLRDILPELMEEVPLEERIGMWFQHDGAPAHFGNIIREYLDLTFGECWIGRGGPTLWPPRSPDLTPLDFYVWGRMKELVYSSPVENEIELVGRIVEAGAIIQEENANIWQSMENRLHVCNRLGGRHFEQFL